MINREVRELIGLVGPVLKEYSGCIIKIIAHCSGFLTMDHDELLISIAQCVAVTDHVGTDANGF